MVTYRVDSYLLSHATPATASQHVALISMLYPSSHFCVAHETGET